MSGLLLTSDNIYGLVNPPPDPVDDLPELHQTINSAAVRWDYFVDLSNNIASRLVAGNNITIQGNVISVSDINQSGNSYNSISTSQLSNSYNVISTSKLSNIDLCNNSIIELVFDTSINYLENYEIGNFQLKQNSVNVRLGGMYVTDGNVYLTTDYSSNVITDSSNNQHIINITDISNRVFLESFEDQRHIGNFQDNGVYVQGVNPLGYAKKGVSGEAIYQIPSSLMKNNVKAISFWVKDYECSNSSWLVASDISSDIYDVTEILGENDLLIAYGGNLKTIYFDGQPHQLSPRNVHPHPSVYEITPDLSSGSFSGWHHIYIEANTTFPDIDILSRDASYNSLGAIDEIRMYSNYLTESEVKGLAIVPTLRTLSDLSNIELQYQPGSGTNDNLKTVNELPVQRFLYFNHISYYEQELLSYMAQFDINIKDLSENINVRLGNLSQNMVESIVPVLTDVSLNKGTIEINFTKDISALTTYDSTNFTVRYDDANASYNTIDIENGNVILKQLTELGGGTALLTSPNSTLTTQTYSASTEQSSTSSTSSKAFDGQLTGQDSNTWKSSTGTYSSGIYQGSEVTQGYSGEWIQVDMGDNDITGISTKVNSFTIKPQQNTTTSVIDTHPSNFKVFASNDPSSWTEISSITDLSRDSWYSNSNFNNYTVTLSSPKQYQYWRLVVSTVVDGSQVSIGELDFNGSIVTNTALTYSDSNKLEIAYRRSADAAKNLTALIGGGKINDFIYKGLGLTNITKEVLTDLSDVSLNSIIEGQFVKFDGTHFVPTNDISDISLNLAQEIDRAISKEANIDGAISTINGQLTALLTDAPATLDTLKEIADVLGDPTDASGGIGTILNKMQDLSDNIASLSTQSSSGLGDLSGQTTSAINAVKNELLGDINDLSVNVANRIEINTRNQTFFEMMTQQPSTFSISGDVISTAADVTINWTYDNILANASDTILAKLAFQTALKSKNIPFIDNITLEISGNINTGNSTYDNNTNTWITFTTGIWPKTFGNNENYNSLSYKSLTINKVSQEQSNSNSINNILSKTDQFDVRIYGTNHSENYPTIDNRSLYFYGLAFATALAPSIPQFSSENSIASDSSITFNYYVAETELNAPLSNGVLIDASNTYFDFETTSSIVSGISITNTNIQTNTSVSNIAKNTNYAIPISSLRAGTKYRFFTAVRNNLTSNTSYSQSSSIITSSFTRLPSSSGASSPTSSWFSVSTYAYRISTPTGGSWSGDNLSNSSVRYLNKSDNDYLQLLNSSRTFEISLPYYSTQQNTQVGFGKFIDNSNNLTEITFSIDGTIQQELVYGGFGITSTRTNKNGNSTDYFSSPSEYDPYNGNTKRQGFRLNGTFSVQDILHSNIGIPSSLGYSLNYTFDKHSDVGGNSISSTFKVYIDEITGLPTITRNGTDNYITAISYCMGIPSVKTFDVSFNRTYSNINSQYQYTRYHSSSPAGITVGLINSISKTNRSSSSYSGKINIDRSDIVTTGEYLFNSSLIDSKTSSRFRDIYFTQTIGMPTSVNKSPSDSISINEKSFNLNGDTNITNNQTFTYYCDYSSFNKSSSKITTPLISINGLGEISNMSVLGTQLNTISTTSITNHEQTLNDWTLLFINGRFRSNISQPYPDVTGYTWLKPPGEGSFTSSLSYNSGNTGYYLNGSTTGSGNKYKWIAFQFTESNATNATVSGIQYTYLNIYNLLSQNYYFTSTVLGYLKNSSNSNVLGFIQQTYNSSSRIGNLSRGYSPSAIWYSQDAGQSLDTIFEGENKSNYGCIFEENSTNWGPILDTTNGSTNITIYIAFNNDLSVG
jgi:hypothetical protein